MVGVEATEARIRRTIGIPREGIPRRKADAGKRSDELIDEALEICLRRDRLAVRQQRVGWNLRLCDLDDMLAACNGDSKFRVAPRRFQRRRACQEDDDLGAVEIREELGRPLRPGRNTALLIPIAEDRRVPARLEQVPKSAAGPDVLGRIADEDRAQAVSPGIVMGRQSP